MELDLRHFIQKLYNIPQGSKTECDATLLENIGIKRYTVDNIGDLNLLHNIKLNFQSDSNREIVSVVPEHEIPVCNPEVLGEADSDWSLRFLSFTSCIEKGDHKS